MKLLPALLACATCLFVSSRRAEAHEQIELSFSPYVSGTSLSTSYSGDLTFMLGDKQTLVTSVAFLNTGGSFVKGDDAPIKITSAGGGRGCRKLRKLSKAVSGGYDVDDLYVCITIHRIGMTLSSEVRVESNRQEAPVRMQDGTAYPPVRSTQRTSYSFSAQLVPRPPGSKDLLNCHIKVRSFREDKQSAGGFGPYSYSSLGTGGYRNGHCIQRPTYLPF